MSWNKDEIDAIIFVSQYRVFIIPITPTILQDKLGLSKECFATDVPMGCSGWVYGLRLLASLGQCGSLRKAQFLTGDVRCMHDKEILDPMFGTAGCATAIDFQSGGGNLLMHCGSDGGGADSIIIPEGGARNRFNNDTFVVREDEEGVKRNGLCSRMNGMDVFSFAISTSPKSIK